MCIEQISLERSEAKFTSSIDNDKFEKHERMNLYNNEIFTRKKETQYVNNKSFEQIGCEHF